MATFAWSTPLVMAATIAAVSLACERRRPWGRLGFAAAALTALALGDTWAFLLAGGCVAAAGMLLAGRLVATIWLPADRRAIVVVGVLLAAGAAVALAAQQATSGFPDDALARAGFGPRWRTSPVGVAASAELRRMIRHDAQWLAALLVASCVYVSLRVGRARGSLQSRFSYAWPTPTRRYFWLLAAAPTIGVMLLVVAFGRFGMEAYHAQQFVWRRDFVILFALVVFLTEIVKRVIRQAAVDRRRSVYLEVGGAVALMAALLAYHNVRIHKFISRNAAYEYFLTADEERLGDWLRERAPKLGRFTLATASHELNYLCAYWTDADLLLPEGFPYHDVSPDDEIAARTADLLALYGATAERWHSFVAQRHPSDQWIWARSRLKSAQFGYLYYLLHRGLFVDGQLAALEPPTSRGVTRRIADRILAAEANFEGRLYERQHRGDEFIADVADRLSARSAAPPSLRPDVIIIDEVSRALGAPNLDGHRREFRHGDIEAWVRTD
jgi:hypothetical protein